MAVFDPNYHSQFYGVMMACHLKQKYEQQYSLQYDLCVRMRFDNLVEDRYPLQKAEEQTVHVIHQTFDKTHRYRCSDVYFSAPSFDYDRICDFYSCLSKYKREWFECGQNLDYGPEHVLAFYKISIQTKLICPKLKRAKQEHYGGSRINMIFPIPQFNTFYSSDPSLRTNRMKKWLECIKMYIKNIGLIIIL